MDADSIVRLKVCLNCENRQTKCNGPCACTADGVDIIVHAQTSCPMGYFEVRIAIADPNVQAAIRRQVGGCKGCGDSPLDGI